ncbi:MAG: hypothetical protein R3B07_11580 [Polyangiaceae bacterium]
MMSTKRYARTVLSIAAYANRLPAGVADTFSGRAHCASASPTEAFTLDNFYVQALMLQLALAPAARPGHSPAPG